MESSIPVEAASGALARTAGRFLQPARDLALVVVGRIVNEVVAQVDIEALLERIDIDGIVKRVDIDGIVGRVDIDGIVQRVDIDAILEKVDIESILDRVDIDSIMARTEMGSLIVKSTSGVASEALDVVRSGAVGIDGAIGRTVDRVLRRRQNGQQ